MILVSPLLLMFNLTSEPLRNMAGMLFIRAENKLPLGNLNVAASFCLRKLKLAATFLNAFYLML
jgi:hypothetical protein